MAATAERGHGRASGSSRRRRYGVAALVVAGGLAVVLAGASLGGAFDGTGVSPGAIRVFATSHGTSPSTATRKGGESASNSSGGDSVGTGRAVSTAASPQQADRSPAGAGKSNGVSSKGSPSTSPTSPGTGRLPLPLPVPVPVLPHTTPTPGSGEIGTLSFLTTRATGTRLPGEATRNRVGMRRASPTAL